MVRVTHVTYIARLRAFVFDKRAGRVVCAITANDNQFVLILDRTNFYERVDKSVLLQAFVTFIHYECDIRVSDMRIVASSELVSRSKLSNKRSCVHKSQTVLL